MRSLNRIRKTILVGLVLTMMLCGASALTPETQQMHIPLLQYGEQTTVHFRPAGREDYTEQEQTLIDALDSAFSDNRLSVDISAAGYDDTEALTDFLSEYFNTRIVLPDGFQGDIVLHCTVNGVIDRLECEIEQISSYTAVQSALDNTPDVINSVEQGRAEALAQVQPGMSNVEKALVLHNYIVRTCDYDYENYQNGTIPAVSYEEYGVYVNHRAVCSGYARAYGALMSAVGIDCYYVASSQMDHAWNIIRIDGNWYHVDCTWDDPVSTNNSRGGGFVSYKYFLRSDDEMRNCLEHYGWGSSVKAQKSGAFVGWSFRPVEDADISGSSYTRSNCVDHSLEYYNGLWHTLADYFDCKNIYGQTDVQSTSYVVASTIDGQNRTITALDEAYKYLFFHDGAFYASGNTSTGGCRASEISRFSTDFSQKKRLYLSDAVIENFNIRQNAFWIITENDMAERLVDFAQSCQMLANGDAQAIYDPATKKCTLVRYSGTEKNMTLPASVQGYTITDIGSSFLNDNWTMCDVVIPQGVTTIRDRAFASCFAKSVFIPAGCTEIGKDVFGSTVTKILVDGNNPKYSSVENNLCDKAGTTLLACVQPMRYFYSIPDGIRRIAADVKLNSQVKTLIVPASVEVLSDTFFSTYLENVCYAGSESEWNAIFRKEEPYPQYHCTVHYNTTVYTIASGACELKDSAKTMVSWTLDSTGLLHIMPYQEGDETDTDWSRYKEAVQRIVVEPGITGFDLGSFEGCINVESISLPADCTEISFPVSNALPKLREFAIAEGNTAYRSTGDTVLTADSSKLMLYLNTQSIDYSVPEGITSIESGAFSHAAVRSVHLPKSITNVDSRAFEHCSSLAAVTVAEGCRYRSIDGVLYTPSGTQLQFYPPARAAENFAIPEGITYVFGEAFSETNTLKRIVIPSTLTWTLDADTFSGCRNVEWYEVSEDNTAYAGQDGAIYSKSLEKLLVYPCGNKRTEYVIPDGTISIERYALFYPIDSVYTDVKDNTCALRMLIIPASIRKISTYTLLNSTVSDIRYCGTQGAWESLIPAYERSYLEYNEVTTTYGAEYPREQRIGTARFIYSADGTSVTASLDTEQEHGYAAFYTADGQMQGLTELNRLDAQTITIPSGCHAKFFVLNRDFIPQESR